MGMLLMSAHILDPVRKLRSFRKWDKAMHIDPEDKTSYTIQQIEAFLKNVEDEHCAKHRCMLANNLESLLSSNLVPSAMASGYWQSSINQYDVSSNDEGYVTPNNVAKTTSG
jgi:hypothetical protein